MTTIFSTFRPSNPFEIMMASYLVTAEGYKPDDIVEKIYHQVYTSTDDDPTKTAKFNKINTTVALLLSAHFDDPLTLRHFKNDIDLIMVFSQITIKVFNLTRIRSVGHDTLYSILLRNECPNLETIYRAWADESHNLYFVVTKTVDTTSFKQVVSTVHATIRQHVVNGLRYLLNLGWNHRDVSIDNLGFNSETNNFVLFDFGQAKNNEHDDGALEKNFNNDIHSLERSIKFHS
jgi:serine/threonine protein kinase